MSRHSPLDDLLNKVGTFCFRFRSGLFPLLFVTVGLIVRPAHFLGNEAFDRYTTAAGVLIALAGGLVRILTIGLVYIKRGGRDKKVYAETLVTDGIFGHVRNPMYLGNLLIAAGICLMYGSLWVVAGVFPLFLFIYISIVTAEERFLAAKFGETFESYCREVPRFLPRLRGVAETFGNYQFNWRRVVKKEYGTTCGLLAGIYLLGLWKYVYLHGIPPRVFISPMAVVPLFIVIAAYIAARYSKKTRRI